jgi:uncharacterized protein (TIGR02217 family)
MSFDDVRLPEDIERGAKGGPRFQTTVVRLSSGVEYRNQDWSRQKAQYEISYGIQTKNDLDDVVNFFYARRGKARGFRFKDWSDYSATTQAIGTGDGSTQNFQLVKTYTSGPATFTRIITRPVTGTITVFEAGVSKAFTLLAGGIVRYTVAPVAAAALTATFEFDVPVRFDQDELEIEMEMDGIGGIPQLQIVEIIE